MHFTLAKPSLARVIRHGHPYGYPYGYSCKCSESVNIRTDIRDLLIFAWISIRISVQITVTDYPYYEQFDIKGQMGGDSYRTHGN